MTRSSSTGRRGRSCTKLMTAPALYNAPSGARPYRLRTPAVGLVRSAAGSATAVPGSRSNGVNKIRSPSSTASARKQHGSDGRAMSPTHIHLRPTGCRQADCRQVSRGAVRPPDPGRRAQTLSFGTKECWELVERMRLDLLGAAGRAGLNVVSTLVFSHSDDRGHISRLLEASDWDRLFTSVVPPFVTTTAPGCLPLQGGVRLPSLRMPGSQPDHRPPTAMTPRCQVRSTKPCSAGGSAAGWNVHSSGKSSDTAPAPDLGNGLLGTRGAELLPLPR